MSNQVQPTAPRSPPGPFPTEPQLRLDPGGHTAQISRTAIDAGARWVVSGSDDKTVRVWRIADGGLETTLRIPLGPGHLGKVYAVAITPDGATVAVGGVTGRRDEGGHSIYLFDRATGDLRQDLGGLPNVVIHLAFDRSGERLAAVLGASNGVRAYMLGADGRWSKEALDLNYSEPAYGVDFAQDGRFATSSYDGLIRLYGPLAPGKAGAAVRGTWWQRIKTALNVADSLKPHRRNRAPGGACPYAVAFSPDGNRIAVGYADSTRVDLLDGRSLAHLGTAATVAIDNGSLSRVAWSADGETLYAGGSYPEDGATLVLRWSGGGLGPSLEPLKATTNSVVSLHPLADGTLLVGASDGLLLLNPARQSSRDTAPSEFGPAESPMTATADRDVPDAKEAPILWSRPQPKVDLCQLILLSPNGDRVIFGFDDDFEHRALFDLVTQTLALDPDPDIERFSPPDLGPGRLADGTTWSVTGWKDGETPRLDGRPLALNQHERPRSLALTSGQSSSAPAFVLGTIWQLRAFDRSGTQRWQQPAPDAVYALNCTIDGRFVVAGYGDGTLRWHRLDTGAEVLAFYPHPDRRRWVLWTPSGHYTASPDGEDLIGWHVNRGPDQAPEFFPASRWRERFNRPDLIPLILATADSTEALRRADTARGQ